MKPPTEVDYAPAVLKLHQVYTNIFDTLEAREAASNLYRDLVEAHRMASLTDQFEVRPQLDAVSFGYFLRALWASITTAYDSGRLDHASKATLARCHRRIRELQAAANIEPPHKRRVL
jgi:hypothetical protein